MPAPSQSNSPPRIVWSGRTDAGPKRENNEDNFGVFNARTAEAFKREQGQSAEPGNLGILFILSDGVGGHNAGEVASETTVVHFADALSRSIHTGVPRRNEVRAHLLREAARQANGAVRQAAAAKPELQGMAATLSALWLIDGHYYLVQVGDSRVYRLREGDLVQLSCDQSEIGRQVFEGQITEEQARRMPGRNVIECAVGEPPERFKPEVDWGEVRDGDLFLLCSDGLSDGFTSTQLEALIRERLPDGDLGTLADHLLKAAITAYGRDNVTLQLAQVQLAKTSSTPPPVSKKGLRGLPTWTYALVAVVLLLALATWLIYLPLLDERDRAQNTASGLRTELDQTQQSLQRMDRQLREAQNLEAQKRDNLAARELELQVLSDERDRLREAIRNLNERIAELDTGGGTALAQAEARVAELASVLDQVNRQLIEANIEYNVLLQQQQRAALTQPMPLPASRQPARASGPRR
ncbi:MAG: protein phosphatase 2C domain-containing protein [Opitutales bacterium]